MSTYYDGRLHDEGREYIVNGQRLKATNSGMELVKEEFKTSDEARQPSLSPTLDGIYIGKASGESFELWSDNRDSMRLVSVVTTHQPGRIFRFRVNHTRSFSPIFYPIWYLPPGGTGRAQIVDVQPNPLVGSLDARQKINFVDAANGQPHYYETVSASWMYVAFDYEVMHQNSAEPAQSFHRLVVPPGKKIPIAGPDATKVNILRWHAAEDIKDDIRQ
ncbi:hypothetical protein ELI44_04150 [Rhizobium ruizarguesonis]|uniref:hypothetical protein n=1 Tax=Rhizobium ruizarguesonis TaxID=2081791 RepID=UPI00103048B2|nr:hypothetical protein [Rhizobium ruizarguesonis]TAU47272.1 hypothetical protein ELI42_04125 [Rhizobium ruizarguesonis]TAU62345.1 hypothetical protein ELI44_04150 [Rhizobium ruizarguesonis]